MALFVDLNLALQLWHCQLSATSWLRKLLLVNSTINWITTRAITEWKHRNRDTWSRRCPSNLRHSAHLFAQAARRSFPDIHLGVIQLSKMVSNTILDNAAGQISNEDLPRIEEEMKKIVKETSHQFVKKWLKTRRVKSSKMHPYKLELIEEHSEDEGGLTIYRQGEYVDLAVAHVPSTVVSKFSTFECCRCSLAWK